MVSCFKILLSKRTKGSINSPYTCLTLPNATRMFYYCSYLACIVYVWNSAQGFQCIICHISFDGGEFQMFLYSYPFGLSSVILMPSRRSTPIGFAVCSSSCQFSCLPFLLNIYSFRLHSLNIFPLAFVCAIANLLHTFFMEWKLFLSVIQRWIQAPLFDLVHIFDGSFQFCHHLLVFLNSLSPLTSNATPIA